MPSFLTVSSDCGSFTAPLSHDSFENVTSQLRCPTACDRCSNCSCTDFPYGIEAHYFSAVVDLSNSSCCKFKLEFEVSARNSVSTGPDGLFYIESWMDICEAPCNNSPTFSELPVAILCVGQCFIYNQGVTDPEGDSLVYRMVSPLNGPNQPVTYNGQYDYLNPLNYNGFKNRDLPFNPPLCRGFHLDSMNGDLMFRPMQVQSTVMAIKVEEWRDGKQIGEVRRDMQIIVWNCPSNQTPQFAAGTKFQYQVCAGDNITFPIYTTDSDANDSTFTSWNGGIPGGTFTTNRGNPGKYQHGTFSWTPTDADVSSTPYYFTVKVQDNACPIKATTIRSFRVKVLPRPTADFEVIDEGCGRYTFKVNATSPQNTIIEWRGPNGLMSRDTSYTHQMGGPGSFPFSLWVSDGVCERLYEDTIQVPPFTSLSIGRDTAVCRGSMLNLSPTIGWGKADSFLWSTGTRDTSITVNVVSDTTFYLTIIDTIGCDNTDTIHIKSKRPPEFSLGPDMRICSGVERTLIPNLLWTDTTDSVLNYMWYQLPGQVTISDSSTAVADTAANYALRITDSLGCESWDTVSVAMNPAIDIHPRDTGICVGDTITITAFWTANSAYQWYEHVSGQPIASTAAIQVHPRQTTIYRVEVTETINGLTCDTKDTVAVAVNQRPQVTLQPLPSRCVDGAAVPLNNYAQPLGGTWSGPGVAVNTFRPNIAKDGTHQLEYLYTDPGTSCSTDTATSIIVHPLPVVDAGPDIAICSEDPQLGLSASPFGGTWSGPGVTSALPPSAFNPARTGVGAFELIYTFTNSKLCENSDTLVVQVHETPEVSFQSVQEVCEGSDLISLQATPAGGQFSGPFVNGNFFDPQEAGLYELKYVFTGLGDCADSQSTWVRVNPLPNVSATTVDGIATWCASETDVALDGLPANGTWSGPAITGTSFNPSVAGEGIHTLVYSYTDAKGCAEDDTLLLQVQPEPQVAFLTDPVFCEGEDYVLEAEVQHASGLAWTFAGDGTASANTGTKVTYLPGTQDNASGSFEVSISSTGNGECVAATATRTFGMHPMPEPDFTADHPEGCSPHEVQFTNRSTISSGSIASYAWTFGDGETATAENPIHVYEGAGTYTVQLTATSDQGCEETITRPEFINVLLAPDAEFQPLPERTTIALPVILFENRSLQLEDATHTWNFGDYSHLDGGTSKEYSPTWTYSDTGSYLVTLEVLYGNGCLDLAEHRVYIEPDITVFIPSAFSPDGLHVERNNEFKPEVFGITSFKMQIFNRWGEMLFETEDENQGWGGTYDGHQVPEGVYVYSVKAQSSSGKVYTYSGTVTLFR